MLKSSASHSSGFSLPTFSYSDRSTFPSFREKIDDIVPSLMHVYSLAYCAMLAPGFLRRLDTPSTCAVMEMSQRSYDILTGRVDIEHGGLMGSRDNGIRDICLRNSRYFYTEYLQRLAFKDVVPEGALPSDRRAHKRPLPASYHL